MNFHSEHEMRGALRSIGSVQTINAEFLKNCQERRQPVNLPTRLEVVGDDTLRVSCFPGITASAKARLVRVDAYKWAMEYVFLVKVDDVDVEVWRFYIHEPCCVQESSDPDGRVRWDTTNTNITENMCLEIQRRVLDSALVKPRPDDANG